jgi:hypothetical protein
VPLKLLVPLGLLALLKLLAPLGLLVPLGLPLYRLFYHHVLNPAFNSNPLATRLTLSAYVPHQLSSLALAVVSIMLVTRQIKLPR